MSLWAGAKEKLRLEANSILRLLVESGFKKSRYFVDRDMLPQGRNVSVYFAMRNVKLWQREAVCETI